MSTRSSQSPSEAEQEAIWQVRSGFWSLAEIISNVVDILEQEPRRNRNLIAGRPRRGQRRPRPRRRRKSVNDQFSLRERARRIVLPHWDRQLRDQEHWPETTDVDRLAHAFESLERNHKIIARMNLGCCRNCGVDELDHDFREDDTVGFVFFHEQTTQGMVDPAGDDGDGMLNLYFGSFTSSTKKNLDVGMQVVRSLRRAGLKVEWPEDVLKAIQVGPMLWQKRVSEAGR